MALKRADCLHFCLFRKLHTMAIAKAARKTDTNIDVLTDARKTDTDGDILADGIGAL